MGREFSQINGGASSTINPVTDQLVMVRSGTTDLLGTPPAVDGTTLSVTAGVFSINPANSNNWSVTQAFQAGMSVGVASTTAGAITLYNASNANTTVLQSGVAGSNLTFTLPTTAGTNGYAVVSNGSGVLSYAQIPAADAATLTNTAGTLSLNVGHANSWTVSQRFSAVTIGTASAGTDAVLTVNPNTTADNLASVQLNAGSATQKALVIQAFASQTAHIAEWQDSSGTVLGYIGPLGGLGIAQDVSASGTPLPSFLLTGAAHTALTLSTEYNDVYWNLNRTVQFATGAITTQRAILIAAPTYSAVGASIISDAATLAISGPPIAGTNVTLTRSHALWVQSGFGTFENDNIQATSTTSIRLVNATASTSIVTAQWSGRIHWQGHAWGTTAPADATIDAIAELQTTTGTTASGSLVISLQLAGGGYFQSLAISQAAVSIGVSGAGTVNAGALSAGTGAVTISGSSGIVLNASGASVIVGTSSGTPATNTFGASTGSGTNVNASSFIIQNSTGTGTGSLGRTFLRGSVSKQASGATAHAAVNLVQVGSAQSAHPGTTGAFVDYLSATWNDENTGASGSAADWTMYAFETPTLTARNASVTTKIARILTFNALPVASTNQTITGRALVYAKVVPDTSANVGLWSIGSGPWDGSTSGFFAGSSSGTHIAVNAASGFGGNMIDLQVAGARSLAVSSSTITVGNAINVAVGTSTGTQWGTATTQKQGWYGATPVVQQTDGAGLTNNIVASGTTNQLDDFTSLTVYATDAQAIHNSIYQLGRKLKIVDDALRTYGLLS